MRVEDDSSSATVDQKRCTVRQNVEWCYLSIVSLLVGIYFVRVGSYATMSAEGRKEVSWLILGIGADNDDGNMLSCVFAV